MEVVPGLDPAMLHKKFSLRKSYKFQSDSTDVCSLDNSMTPAHFLGTESGQPQVNKIHDRSTSLYHHKSTTDSHKEDLYGNQTLKTITVLIQ